MSHAHDELAIRNLAYAYSDAVGRRDAEAMVAVYAPDGELVVASTGATMAGTAKLLKGFRRLVEVDREFLVHMTTSGVVEIQGDRATARWWFNEVKRHTGETFYRYILGVYEDEVARLDVGWRFTRRRASALFEWQLPAEGMSHFPPPAFLPINPLAGPVAPPAAAAGQ